LDFVVCVGAIPKPINMVIDKNNGSGNDIPPPKLLWFPQIAWKLI
jgi:hypothetical protein